MFMVNGDIGVCREFMGKGFSISFCCSWLPFRFSETSPTVLQADFSIPRTSLDRWNAKGLSFPAAILNFYIYQAVVDFYGFAQPLKNI